MITDLDAFRQQMAADDAGVALELLWSGHPEHAELALIPLLAKDPDSPRLLALQADCWRDLGRICDATARYCDLIKKYTGTPREATLRQHLGKTLFAAGQYAAAAGCFQQALQLRRTAGASAELIESSELACRRTAEMLRKAD